jgi:hypothetical protein
MARKYTEEILREAVGASLSVAAVLRYLGVAQTGGGHAHISRTIKRMGIDTSHFTGQGWRRGRKFPTRQEPSHWLRVFPPGSPRINGERLRKALLRTGRPYVCVLCGNRGMWLMRPMTLHVDHINGDYLDCRPENLRFLCPNCHSQTPTHAGRNRRRARHATPDVGQGELSLEVPDSP